MAADLAAKMWARAALDQYGPAIDFLPFIALRLTFNRGISFGLLAYEGIAAKILLFALSCAISVLMTLWAYRTPFKWEGLGFSLIVAGAWANVIDRALFGAVTDYLDLHFGSWHLFVFNLADIWISAGVCLLLIAQFSTRDVQSGQQRAI